jgi:YHS domain-containing protein
MKASRFLLELCLHSQKLGIYFSVRPKAKCPVTGDEFTISKDTQFSEYKGKYYAFCCPGCKPQFDKNPEKYLK